MTVPQPERGKHFVAFTDSGSTAERGLRRYVLASKGGSFPNLATSDFHWVANFPSGGDGSAVVVTIESGLWEFGSPELYLIYGLLPEGAPQPQLPPDVGEFGVISFELCMTTHDQDSDPSDSARFVPERLELPAELREAYRQYYAAYSSIDGHEISFQDVKSIACPSTAFTYGEAHFLPLYRLLQLLGAGPGDILADLGSGTGRLVLAAALSIPQLTRCLGIELLPGLHAAALSARAQAPGGALVEYLLGDFTGMDWSEATIVVAMTLCFPEELLEKLERQAMLLRPGTRLVVMHCYFGEFLPPWQAKGFRPVELREEHPRHAVPLEMSFGETPLYVFERIVGLDMLD